jgi:hypothetical protein
VQSAGAPIAAMPQLEVYTNFTPERCSDRHRTAGEFDVRNAVAKQMMRLRNRDLAPRCG